MDSRRILVRSLIVATAIGGLSAIQVLVNRREATGVAIREVSLSLTYFYAWALLVPVLAPFFARFPLAERPWRHSLYYAAAGMVASLVPTALNLQLAAVSRRYSSPNEMRSGPVLPWVASFMVFWIIAGIFQVVVERQKVRQLRDQLSQAELQNLKSQLQPHFLFNTLHTISILIRQDAEAANGLLLKLSDLLRVSLAHSRADQIPLQEELDFLGTYLSIEQTRFQERLHVCLDVDGETRAALIPTLLLQPLVENAVRHGIAPRAAGGTVTITARHVRENLELQVDDDGSGLAEDYAARRDRGCGLRNTEGRLRALYGDAASFMVAPRQGGGVRVSVSVPYRPS